MKKSRSPDVDLPPIPALPDVPSAPAPAATDGTFYSMLDMLQRQDLRAKPADPKGVGQR